MSVGLSEFEQQSACLVQKYTCTFAPQGLVLLSQMEN